MLNIVLHEPEIPANTGNIGRTCVAAGARLHLIEPLGFQINEKQLKRAGLDYWDKLDVTTYVNFEDFLAKNPGAKIYMATTKARKKYTDVRFEDDAYIMFGKESAGIPALSLPNIMYASSSNLTSVYFFLALVVAMYIFAPGFFARKSSKFTYVVTSSLSQ